MIVKAIVTLIYGVIIAGGGIIGYVTARSLPSLISGSVLGLLSIIGGIMMFSGKGAGRWLSLVAALLVAVFFAFQLFKGLSSGGAVGRAAAILGLSLIEILVLLLVKSAPGLPR
jgi:uncharacterized membrane protein (UPF0136 family)